MKNIEAKIEALEKEVQKMKATNAKQVLLRNVQAMKYTLQVSMPKPRPMNPDHIFIQGQDFKPHSKEVKIEEVKPAPKRRRKKALPKLDSDLLADNK